MRLVTSLSCPEDPRYWRTGYCWNDSLTSLCSILVSFGWLFSSGVDTLHLGSKAGAFDHAVSLKIALKKMA